MKTRINADKIKRGLTRIIILVSGFWFSRMKLVLKKYFGIPRIIFVVMLLSGLVSSLTGCEGVRKKFTRPPKKTEEPKHIALPIQEYVEAYPKDITYNNHFIFWKYWHQELIDCLGRTNRKKELECAEQLLSNLEKMRSLLAEEKGKELDPYLKELNKTIGQIKQGNLSDPKIQYLKRDLEKQKRQIDREFALHHVRNFILP